MQHAPEAIAIAILAWLMVVPWAQGRTSLFFRAFPSSEGCTKGIEERARGARSRIEQSNQKGAVPYGDVTPLGPKYPLGSTKSPQNARDRGPAGRWWLPPELRTCAWLASQRAGGSVVARYAVPRSWGTCPLALTVALSRRRTPRFAGFSREATTGIEPVCTALQAAA